ncbi:MAG TPA: PDZ domain-containing protein [Longimicrobiales bacterium]
MKRGFVTASLLVSLSAGLPHGAAAQARFHVYNVRDCARIGIAIGPADPLVVAQVLPGSPAARAGIQPHDTLLAIDGAEVDRDRLPEVTRRLRAGDAVRVRIRRDGRVREIDVVPAADVCVEAAMDSLLRRMRADQRARLDTLRRRMLRTEREWAEWRERVARRFRELNGDFRTGDSGWLAVAAPSGPDALPVMIHVGRRTVAGVEFTELNSQLAAYFEGAEQGGLLVLQVAPGTPGARTGFQPGDVVVGANGRPIRSIGELRSAIAGARGAPVTISIVRRGEERRLVYRQDD